MLSSAIHATIQDHIPQLDTSADRIANPTDTAELDDGQAAIPGGVGQRPEHPEERFTLPREREYLVAAAEVERGA